MNLNRGLKLFGAALAGALLFQNCGSQQFETLNEGSKQPSMLYSDMPPAAPTSTVPAPVVLTESTSAKILSADAIDGIHAGEIFQRRDNGQGIVHVAFKAVPSELPFFAVNLLNANEAKERTLISGLRNGMSEVAFELATGMASRKVRISFHNSAGVEQARWTSPGFSVGEVFLVAGQSNGSNHGEYPTSSRVALNRGVDPVKKSWVPMADPLPFGTSYADPPWNNPSNPGGSPWPSFADELSAKLQVPVAVVSLAYGGSALNFWLPGAKENFFARLLTGASSVPSCGFRAVLWHEGESDSIGKTAGSVYQAQFQTMVSAFRASTGCTQPWMIAQVSYLHSKYWQQQYTVGDADARKMKWTQEVELRKAQRALAASLNFKLGPDTDLLVGSNYRFDDLHFNVRGLALHGRMWSERIQKMLGLSSVAEKDLIPEVKNVWTTYESILKRTPAAMEQDVEGVRYWVDQLSHGYVTQSQFLEAVRNSDEAKGK